MGLGPRLMTNQSGGLKKAEKGPAPPVRVENRIGVQASSDVICIISSPPGPGMAMVERRSVSTERPVCTRSDSTCTTRMGRSACGATYVPGPVITVGCTQPRKIFDHALKCGGFRWSFLNPQLFAMSSYEPAPSPIPSES